MKQLIVGDVHGCFEELLDLFERAGISDGDEVIALGDVVDRGPATPAVIDLLRRRACTRVLMGNHERKHIRALRGEVNPALSQRISRHQIGEENYADACAWMATLPVFIELPQAILVHGMFEPGVAVHEQKEAVVVGTLTGERYLSRRHSRPWYELYDGELPLVVGHQNIGGERRPYVRRDGLVYGLDTGCCSGGTLSGLLLPEFRLVSVPSRANHWSVIKVLHRDLYDEVPALEDLRFEELERRLLRARGRDVAKVVYKRFECAEAVLEEAEAAITGIYSSVVAEHEQILARLRLECGYDILDERAQGQCYARALRDPKLAVLLHQQRRGRLTRDSIRKHVKTPRQAIALAAEYGGRCTAGYPTADRRS